MIRRLVAAGDQTEYVNLDLVSLGEGQCWETAPDLEMAAVVLAGCVDARADDRELGRAGGRPSVFEGAGHGVYGPAGTVVRLTAVDGPSQVVVASATPGSARAGSARVIGPDDQRVTTVGTDNWSRTVRTILGPDDAASRLLLGETVNPPGHWSSYPPHKHDTQAPPEENRLEEIYLFQVDPADGFGVQVRYDDQGDAGTTLVHHGDVAVISSGYHPVVAAPGYALYYLWVMAGERRVMAPHLDTRYAWVLEQSRR